MYKSVRISVLNRKSIVMIFGIQYSKSKAGSWFSKYFFSLQPRLLVRIQGEKTNADQNFF